MAHHCSCASGPLQGGLAHKSLSAEQFWGEPAPSGPSPQTPFYTPTFGRGQPHLEWAPSECRRPSKKSPRKIIYSHSEQITQHQVYIVNLVPQYDVPTNYHVQQLTIKHHESKSFTTIISSILIVNLHVIVSEILLALGFSPQRKTKLQPLLF